MVRGLQGIRGILWDHLARLPCCPRTQSKDLIRFMAEKGFELVDLADAAYSEDGISHGCALLMVYRVHADNTRRHAYTHTHIINVLMRLWVQGLEGFCKLRVLLPALKD